MRRSCLLVLAAVFAACGGKVTPTPVPSAESSGGGVGEGHAAPSAPADPPSTPCSVSFTSDVLPALATANCSERACHGGGSPTNAPMVEPTRAGQTYDGFVSFRLSSGQSYILPGATDDSAHGIDCNLRGECGVAMPLGGSPDGDLLSIVEDWLACGAPKN